jgi:hypothetical protein
MPKAQRIRDPVHDLVEFNDSSFDQMAWSALNTPEFQRLRRIKQLGFSELVFPGATHSRFAHSVGVFHMARWLSRLIEARLGKHFNNDRAEVAKAAALVHDLGHGPFSHAFEDALRHLGTRKRHEDWTAEIVTADTEVARILSSYRDNFQADVATLLASETPVDIYSAIVSSQFDADRLDYVQRDRLMTGAQHGGFDLSWLMANLEVDHIAIAREGESYGEVESLILGNKAIQSAEAYVLGLFHLYLTVYFHKATRSAEKMLSANLRRLGQCVGEGRLDQTGLTERNPIVQFLRDQSLENYLKLDDSSVWASFQLMCAANDGLIAELSYRLLNRNLFKAIDVTAKLAQRGGEASVARFRARLAEEKANGNISESDLLEDQATRNPYERRGYDSPEALTKVLIRRVDGTGYEDLADRSDVVAALREESVYRVYVRNQNVGMQVENIVREIAA